MDIRTILQDMAHRGASDLHMKVGSPPTIRIDGALEALDYPPPSPDDLETMAAQIMGEDQLQEFRTRREVDFAFALQNVARFRANVYYQRSTVAMAIRTVPLEIPTFEDLNLPDVLLNLTQRKRGLVLVTGTVGSGKSTTLASMIDGINRREARNIITLEDPVEFLHRDNLSMISQREVGLDTMTYGHGLKYILRQDPDVILLGEIRDADTMRVALMAADTGHLVFSTLHTTNAPQTVNRILSFFPPHQAEEIRFLMATTLAAIVTLRLVPRANGAGRVPAVEVMVVSDAVREMILDAEKTFLLPQAIQEGVTTYGMQSFDQSLMDLYTRNLITLDEALRAASSPTEFQLRIQGIHAASDTSWGNFEKKDEESKSSAVDKTTRETPEKRGPAGISRF